MIYLAGKISDKDKKTEALNKGRFFAKAQELRLLGVDVFNPVDKEMEGEGWEFNLARDIHHIFNLDIDGIYLMKGWEQSKGARLELEACKILAKKNPNFKIIKEQ